MIYMTYRQAISYIYSLEEERINLGLSRIKSLLTLLQISPEVLKVIHIAGTNGKGSVAEMVSNILAYSGYKVGVYTSPHLKDFRERIVIKRFIARKDSIDRELIPEKKLVALVREIKPLVERIARTKAGRPTFFEVTTAIMFAYFIREKVDFAVIEVGLGGRLDATNVVSPLVSVITNIGLEHTDRLGKTLRKIAREKCGIIKRESTVVTADCNPEVLGVIRKVCSQKKARLIRVRKFAGRIFTPAVRFYKFRHFHARQQSFDYYGSKYRLKGLAIPLMGEYQLANASCAIAALECVDSLRLTPGIIRKGLRYAKWPARLEVLRKAPFIIADGAHNPPAARMLKKAIEKYFKYENLILVIGILNDKDAKGILGCFLPLASKVILTRPFSPRASIPFNLASLLPPVFHSDIFIIPDPAEGLKYAVDIAGRNDLVLVTGSLYLAGAILKK